MRYARRPSRGHTGQTGKEGMLDLSLEDLVGLGQGDREKGFPAEHSTAQAQRPEKPSVVIS